MSNSMNEGQMVPKIEEKIEDANIVVNESDQGMMAAGSEGERRVRTGPDGNPTAPLTDAEHKQYLENYNN